MSSRTTGSERFQNRARSQRFFCCVLLGVFASASIATAQEPASFKAQPPEIPERPDEQWFNSKPLKLAELHGQVVVLHFWTFGCINCKHNDSAYKAWYQKYSGKGVTMIGVHTPETVPERNLESLQASIRKRGLKYPVVADTDGKTWKAWGNRWWPSIYLIDKQGFCRYRWDGELGWKGAKGKVIMEKKIDQLLAEEVPATPAK
jgi:peroxiredoxin